MYNILNDARSSHKEEVNERINQVGQLRDITSITENLFSMSKEMAKMEAEIFELKQKQAISQEIKSVLDAWVRHEGQLREREQRLIAEQVLARVMTGLEDPKLVHS